jgi:hypothetical protein
MSQTNSEKFNIQDSITFQRLNLLILLSQNNLLKADSCLTWMLDHFPITKVCHEISSRSFDDIVKLSSYEKLEYMLLQSNNNSLILYWYTRRKEFHKVKNSVNLSDAEIADNIDICVQYLNVLINTNRYPEAAQILESLIISMDVVYRGTSELEAIEMNQNMTDFLASTPFQEMCARQFVQYNKP